MLTITPARSAEDLAEVKRLALSFTAWLRGRYPEDVEVIDAYLAAQNFLHQLDNLLDTFGPPGGECLLARLDGQPAGIVMLKPNAPGTCEMNRMFVTDAARGQGVALALGQAITAAARQLGYARMILTAGPKHREAIPLYRKLGFIEDDSAPDTGAGKLNYPMSMTL